MCVTCMASLELTHLFPDGVMTEEAADLSHQHAAVVEFIRSVGHVSDNYARIAVIIIMIL